MKFLPWLSDDENDGFAWVTYAPNTLRNEPKEWELHEGVAIKHWFPENIVFPLADDRGIELTDAIPNSLNLIFASERLKGCLQEHSASRIEFLPIKLQDQKDRMVPASYYLMNVLDVVECVNLEQSKFMRSAIDPTFIARFFLLVLDESRIPPEAKLFRLKEKPNLVMVREDLAQALVDGDYNGMMFLDLEEYGKEWGRR